MSAKWVVFDFCETLVNLQTADAFVDFCVKDRMSIWRRFWSGMIRIFTRMRIFAIAQWVIPRYNLEKRMRVFLLRGFSREDMERLATDFVNEVLLGASNGALQSRLEEHLRAGDWVQISSGGIGVYLRIWGNKHAIWEVDATELEFRDGRCTGFLLGADCLYEEKVKRLENRMELDAELGTLKRVVYSDSITDLPLLKWADEAWVVSYEKNRAWVKNYNLKELVIGRNNGGLEV